MQNNKQTTLEKNLFWMTSSMFSEQVQDTILNAAVAIQTWLKISGDHQVHALEPVRQKIGPVLWEPSSSLWRKAGFHHVEFHTVFIDPAAITIETAVHEMAHVLDNALGMHRMASIFGGGPADEMIRYIGGEPDLFLPRFFARKYEIVLRSQQLKLNPLPYGQTRGPAEDFAESFRLAVLHPELLKTAAPKRFNWFSEWRNRLLNVNRFSRNY